MPLSHVILRIDYPPSTNKIWRQAKAGKAYLSDAAKQYYRDCSVSIRHQLGNLGISKPYCRPVAMLIDVYPPDQRRRDLDNLAKPILDALVKGGVLTDDSYVHELRMRKRHHIKYGRVYVQIMPHPGEDEPVIFAAMPTIDTIDDDNNKSASPKETLRKCLKCNQPFRSASNANRICEPCNRDNKQLARMLMQPTSSIGEEG